MQMHMVNLGIRTIDVFITINKITIHIYIYIYNLYKPKHIAITLFRTISVLTANGVNLTTTTSVRNSGEKREHYFLVENTQTLYNGMFKYK